MADTKSDHRPRRDADGRLATFPDLLAMALAGLVTCVVVLLLFEAVMSLTRLAEFGDTSGWLALILPLWLFTEEFRAVGFGAYRVVAALLGAGFGVAVGLTLAGLVSAVYPPLVSGSVAAVGFTIVYCAIWFYGMRWLEHRAP